MSNKTIILSLFVTVNLAASAMAKIPEYVPSEGLIGWWPFNGNADDESANANNGTVYKASLSPDRFGALDKAFSFNGVDNYISVLTNDSLQPRTAFTISLWAYIDPTKTTFLPLVSKYLNKSPSWGSYGVITGNGGRNQEGDAGVTVQTNNIYKWSEVTGVSHLNEWFHIVGAYDGSTLKCYKNGVLVSTGIATGEIQYSPSNVQFGRGINANGIAGADYYFKGNIDDIGMWNRALSPQEVTELYKGIESGPRIATAAAEIFNGFVVGVIITDEGSGYVNTPTITITGGGGTGASAIATIERGTVTGISVQNPGRGYTSVPVITITPPPFPPRQATGTTEVVNGFVVGVKILDSGFGYTEPPLIVLVGGGGTGATAVAEVTDGAVTGINLTSTGRGYTSAPALQIAPPPFEPKIDIEVSRVNVRLSLVVGARYQLEASTDTVFWNPTGPSFIAEKPNSVEEFMVESSGRYFRVRQVP